MSSDSGVPPKARKPVRTFAIWGVIAVILAVLANVTGSLVNIRQLFGGPSSVQTSSAPASSSPVAPPSDTSTISTAEQTPERQSSPAPPSFRPLALTLDNAEVTQWCGHSGFGYPWHNSSPVIAAVPHANGFKCVITDAPVSGTVDFLVPKGATRFTATAGQPDDIANTTAIVRFQVVSTVSGAVLEEHDTSFGEAASFDTPIAGVVRIKLVIVLLSNTQSVQPFTNGAAGAGASWADAMLR